MSSPFDIRIPTSKLPSPDDTDLYSLLPGFMIYLKDRYIDLLLETLRRRRKIPSKESEYKSLLLNQLEKYDIQEIPTVSRSLLSTSFYIRRRKYQYSIELDRRAMISRRLSVEQYLRLLEFGSAKVPPKRVFMTSRSKIESRILGIWYQYYDEIGGRDRDRYRDIRQSSLCISEGRLRSRSLRSYKYRSQADIQSPRPVSRSHTMGVH